MKETPLIQQYMQLRSEFLGYIYAITRDVDLAEEVYQNAAVVVIEKQGGSETISNFRAWAKEVIRRQALYSIRKREKSSKVMRSVSPELLDAVSKAFTEDASETKLVLDESTALKQCLASLPKDKRELVALRYEGDASFEEISDKVETSPSAIQRALSRIRKQLHGCIKSKMRLAEGIQ